MSHARISGTRGVALTRCDAGVSAPLHDCVIEEAAVALVYNGSTHAVMMATPHELDDFALGFSLGEGIVAAAEELGIVEVVAREQGIVVEMTIPQVRFDALQLRQRRTLGVSACGLCGSESLSATLRPAPRVVAPSVDVTTIQAALRQIEGLQVINQATGAAHAAAWCDDAGLLLREDVGRHCAFDKLVGALAHRRHIGRDGFALISSRASYELVHKAATAGIGMLVAISAPTSAAIELAERCGVCLVAFARGAQMNVYTHHTRLTGCTAA